MEFRQVRMGPLAAFGLLGVLSSVVAVPQICGLQDPPPCSSQVTMDPMDNMGQLDNMDQLDDMDNELSPCDQDVQPTQNGDGTIRVFLQKDSLPDTLEGFQSCPIPGGVFYVRPNPDIIVQPPPILIKPPQPKPIQPAPIEIQPPPLPPITPPPIYVRPAQLRPINVPPICVKPNPLPPITPPPIVVKPPCPQPIQPPAITIRQPELPLITPPQIVVRPPAPANIQPPIIYFRTSVLENGQDTSDLPLPSYSMDSCSCPNS